MSDESKTLDRGSPQPNRSVTPVQGGDTEAKPLPPDQRRAADLLGRDGTCEEAGHEIGVTKRTVVRWRRLPAFQAAKKRVREAVLDSEHVPPWVWPKPP